MAPALERPRHELPLAVPLYSLSGRPLRGQVHLVVRFVPTAGTAALGASSYPAPFPAAPSAPSPAQSGALAKGDPAVQGVPVTAAPAVGYGAPSAAPSTDMVVEEQGSYVRGRATPMVTCGGRGGRYEEAVLQVDEQSRHGGTRRGHGGYAMYGHGYG